MRIAIVSILLLTLTSFAKSQEKVFDLVKLLKENRLHSVNRGISIDKDKNGDYLKVEESKGEGFVWLPIENFKTGTLTIEMRGKDVPQRSFIGIAFHGQNDSTYDAVYCRPFNFHATDSVRRIHAIQYISHPTFTWKYLRENRNGEFEKGITNAPEPNDWLVMSVVIKKKTVEVFINHSTQPVLTIHKLSKSVKGTIGLFVGNDSGGDFRKLSIK